MSDMWSEVVQVLNRYALGYDSNDSDQLEECFAEEAVMLSGTPGSTHGAHAIRTQLENARARRAAAGERTRHVITNLVIDEATHNAVRLRSYVTLIVTRPGGDCFVALSGQYSDQLVRDGAKWRIIEHSLTT